MKASGITRRNQIAVYGLVTVLGSLLAVTAYLIGEPILVVAFIVLGIMASAIWFLVLRDRQRNSKAG